MSGEEEVAMAGQEEAVGGQAAKRLFDAFVAAMTLMVLLPVLLVAALAIKLDSPGPVFFMQERVGRGGRLFRMFKFRTMVANAASLGPNVSATGDSRFTRAGTLLRRSFIDEAPQLLNVLKGDMSLVGPRPETPEYIKLLSPDEQRILAVRPGMAGPSTLAYSREEPAILARQDDPDGYYRSHLLHQRVAADLAYVERSSLATDLWILARTALFVVDGLIAGVLGRSAAEGTVRLSD